MPGPLCRMLASLVPRRSSGVHRLDEPFGVRTSPSHQQAPKGIKLATNYSAPVASPDRTLRLGLSGGFLATASGPGTASCRADFAIEGHSSRKLRVAHINCVIDRHHRDPAELLDAWPTLALVAEAAAAAGADVKVLQAARTRATHAARGVTYTFVPELRVGQDDGPGLMPWRLSTELRRIEPDVVHFHGFEAPFHLWAVSRGMAPVLIQDHATQPGRRGKRIRRWSLRGVAGFAFTSTSQAEVLAEAADLPRDARVFEILESSTRFTAGDRQDARERTQVFGNPAVLWVGHLNANKDPLTILRAARAALNRLPELQLWCAFGSAELLPEVVSLLREDDELRAHVHLLGGVPHAQVESLCRACDLFVLGSHRESCGYALLEALACGLVPVVTDIPSFRRITGSGAVGALVPPGDVEGFAAALVAQTRALDSMSRMRVLAHFEAHLSPQALGRQLICAYRTLQTAGENR